MKRRYIKNKYLRKLVRLSIKWYYYGKTNVWKDQRRVWYVDLIKTINLSVRSYLDKNLQSRASSLTYNTLLAIIPVFALMFAIARGFGLQDVIQSELGKMLPAQAKMINISFGFVDKYLATASGGVFVGVGILFLLWTLISLLRNIEMTFNYVWGVKVGRSPFRMITDYTAIIIILPILIICSSGISLFMSSVVQDSINNPVGLLSPVLRWLLDIAPWILTCLFFSGMYILIPYTKVKFKYALIAGFICGTLFQLLQYLFVTGQMYVTKYNAIYGSFSFLPLFMIWMYLTWLICISGGILTYSSQNVFRFNYVAQIKNISQRYFDELSLYVVLIVVARFEQGKPPLTKLQIMSEFNVPMQLLNIIVNKLVDAGLFSVVLNADDTHSYQPATNLAKMTIAEFMKKFRRIGSYGFVVELRSDSAIQNISRLLDDAGLQNVKIEHVIKNNF